MTQMKNLRPYQADAIAQCWQALKKDDEPVLLMASVGAGKSLMLASILITMQKAGKRALCLVNNAELVRNNCATFIEQGGDASVYCAALKSKDTSAPIVFGTPQSVLNGIKNKDEISEIKFNIIIVDEAHAINYVNDASCFMRILRHFKNLYPDMRLMGATGTNYRFKGSSIVGEDCIFKSQVGNITTEQLIKDKYLIDPNFEVDGKLIIDFTGVKVKQNGLFDQKELGHVIEKSTRLTELICKQIVYIMETQKRFGVFVFATNKKHAKDILKHLPKYESAIILGDTPHAERTEILQKARIGLIRYIVNIAIVSVGVDVPAYDTVAYLRPTESLVLLVQTMGRALRLSDETNKKDALILDFAGNIQRHSDWDNPILLKALKQTEETEKPLVIICPKCHTMNTDTARRCTGVVNSMRCDYYFEFKLCPNTNCGAKNDISARQCRLCECEIIDPNYKLSLIKKNLTEVQVIKARYGIFGTQRKFRINCAYKYKNEHGKIESISENYWPCSDKARRFFYGNFVKQHCDDATKWYPHLYSCNKVKEMLQTIKTPAKLWITFNHDGAKIRKKLF